MDPVTVIITALSAAAAAGLTAGTQEVVATAVKDAYGSVRDGLRRLWRGRAEPEEAVEGFERDPDRYEPQLRASLKDAHVERDARLLQDAETLLTLAVRYHHVATASRGIKLFVGNQGLQDAEHAVNPQQTNYFGPEDSKASGRSPA